MKSPTKLMICSIIFLFWSSFVLIAQNPPDGPITKLAIDMDINDDDGVLYREQVVQVYLKIKNTTSEAISMQIEWSIETDDWHPLMQMNTPFKVSGNTERFAYCPWFKFPGPGFYNVSGKITSEAVDTYYVNKVIGIDPEKIQSSIDAAADFDLFWESSLKELTTIAPNFTASSKLHIFLEPLPSATSTDGET